MRGYSGWLSTNSHPPSPILLHPAVIRTSHLFHYFASFPTITTTSNTNDIIRPYWKCRHVSLDSSSSSSRYPFAWNVFATPNRHRWTSDSSNSRNAEGEDDFIVVNFYRFVLIENPAFEVSRHLSFLQWLKEDDRFVDLLVQVSPSINGHAFPRLKLRYKPTLVQFEGGDLDLPLIDPSLRATPLTPAEWRQRLESNDDDEAPCEEDHIHINKNYILLDVRNGYEWDIGHFHGAVRPEVECFKSTSFGLSLLEVSDSDPLAKIDKDKTDVMMYCTGGIRCDVYSTILRQKEFKRLYTLEGGISHYLKEEGPVGWTGNLFVFDSRLSLPPSTLNSSGSDSDQASSINNGSKLQFARCYLCGSQVDLLRHRNCANIDCNLLFLGCSKCVEQLGGCCCSECKSAPRLRPLLHGVQRYKKWHHYRDETSLPSEQVIDL